MKVMSGTDIVSILGSDNLQRFWDPIRKSHAVKIFPGQYYVTKRNEMIVTTLGSCVSACIRDPEIGLGGMNHFMLPSKSSHHRNQSTEDPWNTAARYGNLAMELLINTIMRNGGERKNLEVKLFGGAKILTHMNNIGCFNVDFIRKYIKTEGLLVLAEDLGGLCPREIRYFPATGKAQLKRLPQLKGASVVRDERSYRINLNRRNPCGEIELFDAPGMDR
jgi:chemotaxis protein CheD